MLQDRGAERKGCVCGTGGAASDAAALVVVVGPPAVAAAVDAARAPRVTRAGSQVGCPAVAAGLLPRLVLLVVAVPLLLLLVRLGVSGGGGLVGVVLVPLAPLGLGQGLVPRGVLGRVRGKVLGVRDGAALGRAGCTGGEGTGDEARGGQSSRSGRQEGEVPGGRTVLGHIVGQARLVRREGHALGGVHLDAAAVKLGARELARVGDREQGRERASQRKSRVTGRQSKGESAQRRAASRAREGNAREEDNGSDEDDVAPDAALPLALAEAVGLGVGELRLRFVPPPAGAERDAARRRVLLALAEEVRLVARATGGGSARAHAHTKARGGRGSRAP